MSLNFRFERIGHVQLEHLRNINATSVIIFTSYNIAKFCFHSPWMSFKIEIMMCRLLATCIFLCSFNCSEIGVRIPSKTVVKSVAFWEQSMWSDVFLPACCSGGFECFRIVRWTLVQSCSGKTWNFQESVLVENRTQKTKYTPSLLGEYRKNQMYSTSLCYIVFRHFQTSSRGSWKILEDDLDKLKY